MTGKNLRIGIMGFAHVHTPGLVALSQELGGGEVIGADPDPEKARQGGEQFGIEVAADYDDLLDRDLDAVIITAENVHHRPLAEKAAAAGKHVLSEKPLATTVADARAMVEACEKAGVMLSVAFPMRYSPEIAQVAATAQAGRLGTIAAITGTNPGSCPGGWFADEDLAGGGCMMDHTVHVADLMCWITGSVPKTVYAQGNEMITPEFGTDTGGLVAVTFEDGTIATIDCSWSRLPTFPTWGGLTLEVVGSDGTMLVDAFGDYVSTFGERATWSPYGSDPNRAMVAEFFAAIREGREPFITGTDGLNAAAIAAAGYRSKESGQPVAAFED